MDEEEAALDAEYEKVTAELKAAESALEKVRKRWNELYDARSKKARERFPREDELTYAFSNCRCGAPLAYFPKANPREWVCAKVLLGLTNRKTDALVERSFLADKPLEIPKGIVPHDMLPFAFWKIKSDPGRKAL